MSSNINPELIDVTYPVNGQDNSTQGFRDNWTAIKSSLEYAADEITDLQNKAILKSALTGTTIDNNLGNTLIYNARVQQISTTVNNVDPVSNVVTLNFSSGHYQYATVCNSANTSIVVGSGWPAAGQYGNITLEVNVANTSYNLVLPSEVDYANAGIVGLSGNTLSFASTGKYILSFSTRQGSTDIKLAENNLSLRPFNNSSEDVADSAAIDLSVTTSYFSTDAAETSTLAAGVEGLIKVLAMKADSGDMVVTVTNAGWKVSGTGTITFDDIGDACTLSYTSGKWFCIGNNGCTFA